MTSLLALSALALSGSQSVRPNIVFVLADDVGYGDLVCYGATKTRTPNIDRIARDGIRFLDAHSPATVCTPTRYGLLTGEYPFRHPPGAGILSGVAPLCIPKDRATMPQTLKKAGYRTGVVGKWHLGLGETVPDFNGVLEPGPLQVGFDYSFILPATGDRVPCVYVENGRVVGLDPQDPIQVSFRGKVGNDPTGRENPELLKIKPVVGHNDTIVNGVSRIGFMSGGTKARWIDEDMADTFASKATSFIENNAHQPFFLYVPTHDVHAPLLPHKRFNGVSDCGLRGDTLAELDWTVGELLKTLDRLKLTDNTIFVFTSDNGAVENDGYSDPRENLNGHKVNGNLRGEKYSLYEGGHRIPMVLSWPARTPRGVSSNALVCQIDFFRTFAALVGADPGTNQAPDSQNLVAALLNGEANGRDSLVHHKGGANSPLAYREGRHVIVPKPNSEWELFDLAADLSQKNDLAKLQPETVQRLSANLAAIKTKPAGGRS